MNQNERDDLAIYLGLQEFDVALMDRMIHKAQAEEVVVNATTAVDEPVALHRD